jgi:hypothetical protein
VWLKSGARCGVGVTQRWARRDFRPTGFSSPYPAKFSLFQMERFANATMEPAKIAYLFNGREVGRN